MASDERKERLRGFLKDNVRKEFDFSRSDQNRGVPPPPIEKPHGEETVLFDLPKPGSWKGVRGVDLERAIGNRRSRREYLQQGLSLDELSFLLWCTQGRRGGSAGGRVFRTVPSAGNRHALETYLAIMRVEGLEEGLYRYLPLTHQLLLEFLDPGLDEKVAEAAWRQPYPASAAVTFIWTAIPYRMEWRYGDASYKVIALDAGHVCQNLYLACEAIGAGTCAIAAYDQEAMDGLLRVDGKEEFTIYLAPVGRVER